MLSLALAVLLAAEPPSNRSYEVPPSAAAHDVVLVVEASAPYQHALASLQQELWAIGLSLAPWSLSKPLKLGFVFYRPGAEPQVITLTDDFDALHARLREVTAEGEGAPAPLGLALQQAVGQPWRDAAPRTRDVVVIGGSPVSDLHLMKRALETAEANGIAVHWLSLGEGVSDTTLLAPAGIESLRVTLTLGPPAPVPATPVDKKLYAALLQLADTPLYGGPPEARAAAAETLARFKALPVTTQLERACFRMKNVPASVPLFEVKGLEPLHESLDGALELEDAELPESLRKLTKAQRQARLEALFDRMEKRDDEARELAWARIDALKKHKPHSELSRLVTRAVGSRSLRAARERPRGTPLRLDPW